MQNPAPEFHGSLPVAAAQLAAETPAVPKGVLALYACGGTGINNVRPFESLRGASDSYMAEIKPYYLDTSFSNNNAEGGLAIPMSAIVKYEAGVSINGVNNEVDGSGGMRAVNHTLIRDTTPEKVRNILPTYAAALVTSASGGTGSLIAPYLLKELFTKTDIVFVYLVGDQSTDERTNNTINTIQSMEGIARSSGKTVVISYHENTASNPRSSVDDEIQRSISLLSILLSRRNAELDTMDLRTFLQVHQILKDDPHIARLYTRTGVVEQGDLPETVTTAATLTMDRDISGLSAKVRHACMGIMPPEIDGHFANMKHIHFFVDPTGMDQVLSEFNAAKNTRASASTAVRRRVDILSGAQATDDGVVV